jgi:hypothetical protein
VGKDTVVVQLGDVLDRGDNEIGVILLLRELNRQAQAYGGAVHMLNGNHESLNICGDFRYATRGGLLESGMAAKLERAQLEEQNELLLARRRLFAPGGRMARELAKNPTVLMVNDTLFAHGGVLPSHVHYGLERINAEVSSWMRGELKADGSHATPPFLAMGDAKSIMWNRDFGKETFTSPFERYSTCSQLKLTLEALGARHMVVGHTPQISGVNCECGCRVWRVDVGMSSGVLNANPQVLEIVQESGETLVRLITAAQPSIFPQPSRPCHASHQPIAQF